MRLCVAWAAGQEPRPWNIIWLRASRIHPACRAALAGFMANGEEEPRMVLQRVGFIVDVFKNVGTFYNSGEASRAVFPPVLPQRS